MHYRNFGKTGLKVSALGFGTMRLPVIDSDPANINEKEATRMIRYAIDNGLNYVDTAYPYHREKSEEFLGRALKDGYRQKTYLATKLPTWLINSQQDMEEKFTEQLRKLQTDYVDFYLIHSLDRSLWEKIKPLDYFSWAEKKVKEGKIRYLGFSFHDAFSVFKEIVDYYPHWDFVQIQLNYHDVVHQAGVKGLEYAAKKGLAVVIMEPLRGGELANLPRSVMELFDSTGFRRSAVEWSLRWLWNLPEVSVVLSGMSDYEQVKENIELASKAEINVITEEELEVYNKARELFDKLRPIECTGCSYCLPCTVGIQIPDVFDTYNRGYISGDMKRAIRMYEFLDVKASACIECGDCESKCPQNLPIRELLKRAHKELSGEV